MVRAVASLFVLAATYIGTAVAFTGDGKAHVHIDEVCPFLIVLPLATWFHPGLGACGIVSGPNDFVSSTPSYNWQLAVCVWAIVQITDDWYFLLS